MWGTVVVEAEILLRFAALCFLIKWDNSRIILLYISISFFVNGQVSGFGKMEKEGACRVRLCMIDRWKGMGLWRLAMIWYDTSCEISLLLFAWTLVRGAGRVVDVSMCSSGDENSRRISVDEGWVRISGALCKLFD